jgi:hypothetical protein
MVPDSVRLAGESGLAPLPHEGSFMSTRSSKQLIKQAWDAFASRDPGRVRSVFAPDAEWLAPEGNATALALGATHHLVGRDRIVRFLTSEFGTVFVADVSLDFRGLHADGETVVVEVRRWSRARHWYG